MVRIAAASFAAAVYDDIPVEDDFRQIFAEENVTYNEWIDLALTFPGHRGNLNNPEAQ